MAVTGVIQLTSGTIMSLGENVLATAVDASLKQIYEDLKNRPTLSKKRKLVIEYEFTPNEDNESAQTLKDVAIEFSVKVSTPKLGPVTVRAKPGIDGMLFHPEVSENPDQTHIMDEIDSETGALKPRGPVRLAQG